MSSGFVALGLAAVLALGAFLGSGLTFTPGAEAAPATSIVSVVVTSSANCTATATVTLSAGGAVVDPTTVTFTSNASPSSTTANSSGGVASATFYVLSGSTSTVTVTASVIGLTSQTGSASVPCNAGFDHCNIFGYNLCNQCNTQYYTSGCNPCATTYNYNCGYNNNCGIASYVGCGGYNYGCNPGYGTGYGYGYGNFYNNCNNDPCTIFNANCYNNNACTNYAYSACNVCSTTLSPCTNACNYVGAVYNCGASTVNTGAYTTPAVTRIQVLPGPSSVTCGGTTNITAIVVDSYGLRVPDGTLVNFATTLGQITSVDPTQGGTAVASLTAPVGASGTASITVASGGQTANTSVSVTCATAAPPAIPVSVAPVVAAPVQRIITPPSTGSAGLLSLSQD